MAQSAIFKIPGFIELVLRPIGGEVAVFNCTSGATHLLDNNTAAVLDLLLQAPQTQASMVAQVLADSSSVGQDEAERYVSQVLAQFVDLGLLEEHDGPSVDP